MLQRENNKHELSHKDYKLGLSCTMANLGKTYVGIHYSS